VRVGSRLAGCGAGGRRSASFGVGAARRLRKRRSASLGRLLFIDAVATLDLRVAVGEDGTWRDLVGERDVSARTETADVGAVLVLDTEERPHASSQDFADRDAEGRLGRVLQLERGYCVHDPIEAQDRVDEYGEVVPPNPFIA
jgi:hypothetical protein